MTTRSSRTLLIVYFDLGIGGVQRKIIDIVNRMAADPRYKTVRILMLLTDTRKNTLLPLLRNTRARVIYRRCTRIPWWTEIALHILLHRPECILAFLPVPALQVAKALRLPYMRHIRFVIGEDVVTSHAYQRQDFGAVVQRSIPWVFGEADAVIAPSPAVAADLSRVYGVPPRRITVLPNWAPPRPAPDTKKAAGCLYAGRFDPEKRIPLLVALFARAKTRAPRLTLRLVGEGKETEKIRSAIQKHRLASRVRLYPPATDISGILHRSSFAVFTSVSEGAPMFLLEAMAAGLPVVAMYFRGIEGIVVHKKTGFICRTQEEFITAMALLTENGRIRAAMSRRSRAHAHRQFSPANIDTFIRLICGNSL